MKNKFSAIIAIAALSLVSCKNDKVADPAAEAKKNDQFTIMMDLVVQEDDNFQIYYNEDGTDNFMPDKYVNVDVKGKKEEQEIVFKLPEDVLPKQLRFDIGSNKNQKEVKIVAFKMKYYDKNFEAKDTLFWNYFGNNTSIKYIRDKAIAVPLPNNPDGYDPIFGGTAGLAKQLATMVQ